MMPPVAVRKEEAVVSNLDTHSISALSRRPLRRSCLRGALLIAALRPHRAVASRVVGDLASFSIDRRNAAQSTAAAGAWDSCGLLALAGALQNASIYRAVNHGAGGQADHNSPQSRANGRGPAQVGSAFETTINDLAPASRGALLLAALRQYRRRRLARCERRHVFLVQQTERRAVCGARWGVVRVRFHASRKRVAKRLSLRSR